MKHEDYKSRLLSDKKANSFNDSIKNRVLNHTPQFEFIKRLRKAEYYFSKRRNPFFATLFIIAFRRYRRSAIKFGYSIPLNVAGKGITLPHYGTIVIHPKAKVGINCMIHVGVNIGMREGDGQYPVIGDNVYIGPGAKIFGPITIADNCYIGANAVVNKSALNSGSVIVGAPAKVVREEKMSWWQKNRLDL